MADRKARAAETDVDEEGATERPKPAATDAGERKGPLKPNRLDRLIHERVRLGIVSALAVNESLSFNDLKKILRTTDGNLSVHARKLEDAGYLGCEKTFQGRVPHTVYRLTRDGRRALERYLGHMEAVIHATRRK